MPNTYTQVHIQFVFAVKFRASLIHESWKNDLYKYITGIVQANKHKLLAINGMPDHIHILVGLRPTQSMADLMQDVKSGSSGWINLNKLTKSRFEWQEGYGAFSYNKSTVQTVINYINNQQIHHQKQSFLTEYLELMKEFEIEYDERFIFGDLQ